MLDFSVKIKDIQFLAHNSNLSPNRPYRVMAMDDDSYSLNDNMGQRVKVKKSMCIPIKNESRQIIMG